MASVGIVTVQPLGPCAKCGEEIVRIVERWHDAPLRVDVVTRVLCGCGERTLHSENRSA